MGPISPKTTKILYPIMHQYNHSETISWSNTDVNPILVKYAPNSTFWKLAREI